MELESERLRQFYTKKIENLQKKYQSQLHALKRGTPAVVDSRNDQESDEISQLLSQLTTENAHLSEKINVLEEELLQTAEELGRVKAISATSLSTSTSPAVNTETPSTELMNRVHQLENEILKLQQTPSPSPPDPQPTAPSVQYENMIKELRLNLSDALQMHDKYLFQINELTQNCSKLQNEKSELQAELILCQTKSMSQTLPHSPKMTQFLIMEQKLNDVEGRLQRRETELLKLLEENKMTGNMERMRLQSLHEQVKMT